MKLINIIILSLALVIFACKKDHHNHDDHNHSSNNSSATVTLKFSFMHGANNFQFNTNYTDDYGTVYQIARAEFYLSNVKFFDHDSNAIFVPGKYFIIRPTTQEYPLGVPSDNHLHGLSFFVGVDSATNHSDPTTYPAESALSPQTPSMHWSWSTGYRFLVLEGVADRDADNIPESPFSFHIGMDAMLATVYLNAHVEVIANNDNKVNIKIDYSKFFTGVDMASPATQTHTMDNMNLANAIKINIPTAFSLQ
jgi:hypothetical protein